MAEAPFDFSGLTPEACRPAGLDLDLPGQKLCVAWADGLTSTFPLGLLRRHCPCATCRADREKSSPLPILSARQSGDVKVTGGAMVGNYAIQFDWSDGHNTGIYDFRLLRTLQERLSK